QDGGEQKLAIFRVMGTSGSGVGEEFVNRMLLLWARLTLGSVPSVIGGAPAVVDGAGPARIERLSYSRGRQVGNLVYPNILWCRSVDGTRCWDFLRKKAFPVPRDSVEWGLLNLSRRRGCLCSFRTPKIRQLK